MATELEEIVEETIEDVGMEAVMEKDGDKGSRPSWETWVALSSSILAVISAVAALLAAFESDEAAIAEAAETNFAVYAESYKSVYIILQTKVDLLVAMGLEPGAATLEELASTRAKMEAAQSKSETAEEVAERRYETHDHLAIAVTLFQLSILLGGLAALLSQRRIWVFGMIFTLGGLGFLAQGLTGL